MSKKAKAAGQGKVTGKIKVSDLMTKEFQVSFAKLINSDDLSAETSYLALQVFEEVVKHQKNFEGVRMRILAKHCQKDDKGELLMSADKTEYLLSDRPAFDREYAELMDVKADISMIPLSCIANAKISPAMLKPLLNIVVST